MSHGHDAEGRYTFHVHFVDKEGHERVREFERCDGSEALAFAGQSNGRVIQLDEDGSVIGEVTRADEHGPWIVTGTKPR